jgi:hypothetical protein
MIGNIITLLFVMGYMKKSTIFGETEQTTMTSFVCCLTCCCRKWIRKTNTFVLADSYYILIGKKEQQAAEWGILFISANVFCWTLIYFLRYMSKATKKKRHLNSNFRPSKLLTTSIIRISICHYLTFDSLLHNSICI